MKRLKLREHDDDDDDDESLRVFLMSLRFKEKSLLKCLDRTVNLHVCWVIWVNSERILGTSCVHCVSYKVNRYSL
jgi:hypothetical protein